VNGKLVDEWKAGASLPSAHMDGHTSTRHTSNKLELQPGDTIRVDGVPDRGDQAGIDYIEIR
jgi:alpha-glucuronidase